MNAIGAGRGSRTPRTEGRRILSPPHSFSKQPIILTYRKLSTLASCGVLGGFLLISDGRSPADSELR
jgi:hypothetical protein